MKEAIASPLRAGGDDGEVHIAIDEMDTPEFVPLVCRRQKHLLDVIELWGETLSLEAIRDE